MIHGKHNTTLLISYFAVQKESDISSSARVEESDFSKRILVMPFSLCYNDKQGVIICVTVAHVSLVFRY